MSDQPATRCFNRISICWSWWDNAWSSDLQPIWDQWGSWGPSQVCSELSLWSINECVRCEMQNHSAVTKQRSGKCSEHLLNMDRLFGLWNFAVFMTSEIVGTWKIYQRIIQPHIVTSHASILFCLLYWLCMFVSWNWSSVQYWMYGVQNLMVYL